MNDRRFNVSGYVGPTPKNIDLLVGIPQLRNMGLVIDFSSNQPVATITKLDNLRIPLLSGNNNPAILHIKELKLPELSIESDQNAATVPYQHPTGYPVPNKYKDALREGIALLTAAGAVHDEDAQSITNVPDPPREETHEQGHPDALEDHVRHAPIVNLEQSSKLNVKFKPSTVTQVLGRVTYQCTDDDGTIAICDGRNLRKIHSSISTSDNAVGGAM
jgi:hypothetical protein